METQSLVRWRQSSSARIYTPEQLILRKRSQNKWYHANRAKVAAQKAESYQRQRAAHLAWEARRRAERKLVPFTLTANDIDRLQAVIDVGACEVTGAQFEMSGSTPYAPSLDRVQPGLGYVPGNVRVVCRWINVAMGQWGEAAINKACADWMSRKSRRRLSTPISE